MEQILIANALSKKYGNMSALENVTMHIPKGAIYISKEQLTEIMQRCRCERNNRLTYSPI